jgi:hypothetical protein
MPGDHGYDNEEKERKQRIKKMKAKTSKMRLAVVNKRNKSDFTKILQDDHPYKKKKDHPDDMNTRENRAHNTNQLAIKHQKETPLSRREKQNIADAENRERGQREQPVRERHAGVNPNRDLSDPNWKSNEEHNREYLKKRDKNKRPSYSDGMGNFGDQSLQH